MVFDSTLGIAEGKRTMTQVDLGRLERVDLRTAWEKEAGGFTPWLAIEANLKLLGDTIGVDLELEAKEKEVGPFRADLLCKDTGTGHWVLIENQLEKTDHTHLGQLLTYAAGLDAVTIVWIAARFTEEHRAALDWLNRMTSEDVNFFGLEIELWRVDTSSPAPKFNVVVKPNEWTKRPVLTGHLTETQQLYLEYWTCAREHFEEHKSPLRVGKPAAQSWNTFSIGRTAFSLSAAVSAWYKTMHVQLVIYGQDRLAFYKLLEAQQPEIAAVLGSQLEWRELPDKKESQIRRTFKDVDPADRERWKDHHEKMRQTLEAFHDVFRERVMALDASEFESDEQRVE